MVFLAVKNESSYLFGLKSVTAVVSMNLSQYGAAENVSFGNQSIERDFMTEEGGLRWGAMAMSFIILCTTLGNLLVCLAVIWDRRLQNMTNYFLMSLAIADFLVSILVMPFGMLVELFGTFPLRPEFCIFWVTMDVLMCTASIWHMCTMSMDRYFTLKYPMRYGRNKTKMMVALKIFFVWAVSITISSPICIFGINDTSSVFNEGLCVPTIKNFVIYGSVFAFYIPLTIMLITYVLTIRILWRNQTMMKGIERSDFRAPRYVKRGLRTFLSPPSNEGSGKASYGNSDTDASTLATTQALQSRVNTPLENPIDKKSSKPCSPVSQFEAVERKFSTSNKDSLSARSEILRTKQTASDPISRPNTLFPNAERPHEANKACESKKANSHEGISPQSSLIEEFQEIDTPFKITVYGSSNSSVNSGSRKNSRSLDIKASSMTCLKSSSEFEKELRTDNPKMKYLSPRNNNFLRVSSNDSLTTRKERPSLHAAASFCTVSQPRSKVQRAVTHCHSCSDIDNGKDFKFAEWKQHYSQIQKEMDQILKDSEREQNLQKSPTEGQGERKDVSERRRSQSSSCYLSVKSPVSPANSDTGESMDELDDSSSDNSDLITIKLRPTSLHMYKVTLPTEQSSPLLKHSLRPNGHCQRLHNESGEENRSNTEAENTLSSGSIRNLLKRFNKAQVMSHGLSKRATTNEKKASKVLGIIFAVFVILWTPFFTVNIMSVTCSNCMSNVTPEMMSIFLWMGYVASLANPIIYTMFNTAFRRAFIKIIKCHLCINGSLRGDSTVMSYLISANGYHYGSNHVHKHDNRRNTMVQLFRES